VNQSGIHTGLVLVACDNPMGETGNNPGGETANSLTWTAVTDSTFGSSEINGIAYGGGKFVAVGEDGKMAYSNAQE
jgi:hypothetical protein